MPKRIPLTVKFGFIEDMFCSNSTTILKDLFPGRTFSFSKANWKKIVNRFAKLEELDLLLSALDITPDFEQILFDVECPVTKIDTMTEDGRLLKNRLEDLHTIALNAMEYLVPADDDEIISKKSLNEAAANLELYQEEKLTILDDLYLVLRGIVEKLNKYRAQ